jgi:hypothetical protein
VRPCRTFCMLSFLLVLWSCLNCCIGVFSSLLLSGVRNRCQALRSLRFSSIFCFIWIGQSRVVSVSVCSGVAFQPVHCIV